LHIPEALDRYFKVKNSIPKKGVRLASKKLKLFLSCVSRTLLSASWTLPLKKKEQFSRDKKAPIYSFVVE